MTKEIRELEQAQRASEEEEKQEVKSVILDNIEEKREMLKNIQANKLLIDAQIAKIRSYMKQ